MAAWLADALARHRIICTTALVVLGLGARVSLIAGAGLSAVPLAGTMADPTLRARAIASKCLVLLGKLCGGPSRNRTGVRGFAVRYVTTPPSGLDA